MVRLTGLSSRDKNSPYFADAYFRIYRQTAVGKRHSGAFLYFRFPRRGSAGSYHMGKLPNETSSSVEIEGVMGCMCPRVILPIGRSMTVWKVLLL